MANQSNYLLIEDSGAEIEIYAGSLAEAEQEAIEWAEEGSYDEAALPVWVDVRIYDLASDDRADAVSTVTARIDPPEPACPGHTEHDWQSPHRIVGGLRESPGVWGHGGGVTIQKVCVRCGAGRHIDTWAQRRDTGEQGLEAVTYERPGTYDLPD